MQWVSLTFFCEISKVSFISKFLSDSRLLRQAVYRYRSRFAVGLLILLAVDVLELIPPLLLARAIDQAIARSPMSVIIQLAAMYLAVALIQAACRVGWRFFINRSSMLAGRDLRQSITDHIFELSPRYFDRSRIGDLLSLITNDTEAVRMAVGPGVLTLFDSLFYFLTVPFAMWVLSPELTLISFVPLMLVPLFVLRNEKKIQDRFEAVQESYSAISAFSQETLSGARVLKGLACEDGRWRQFEEKGFEFSNLSMRLARVQSRFGPGLDFLMSLSLVLLVYFGGGQVLSGTVTVGTFVGFQRYIQKMVWPMTAVGMAVTYFQRAFASSHRIEEQTRQSSEIKSPIHPIQPKSVTGRIEFQNVSFSFTEGQPTLENISFEVQASERVGVSGKIGSGKSALLSLVARLYNCDKGQILVDGVALSEWNLRALRASIGYVSQELFLFNASVFENLKVAEGDPRSRRELNQNKIEEICKIARIDQEVLQFAEGYQTVVGERGVTISGGQKQRLTLARALLAEPKILILDDALSAVDVETEKHILEAIRNMSHPPTLLMAAHRSQTLRTLDKVIFLEGGKLVRIGLGSEVQE